jgi:dCMP deaminase
MDKWDKTFLSIASLISEHSTCSRKKVGCVITMDNRIICAGYNGVPSGIEHCEDRFIDVVKDGDFYQEHGKFSSLNEIHAEQNGIAFAAKEGLRLIGGTLYTTVSPCKDCAKLIVATGIIRVVYSEEYDRDKEGINFLKTAKIECLHREV